MGEHPSLETRARSYLHGEVFDPEHVHGNIAIPPASAMHLFFSIWFYLFNTFELSTRDRAENKQIIILAFMELSINDNKLMDSMTYQHELLCTHYLV